MHLYLGQRKSFEEIYAHIDPTVLASLQTFRQNHPPQVLNVHGIDWEYISLGRGDETLLFLHGMTGAYDIWWQQVDAFKDNYRVLTVTYPPVDSLEKMAAGIMAILEHERISQVNAVGSSLGGYLTQYLMTEHPELIHRAVFANTFPPNKLIAKENRMIGKLLPYLPEWLVMLVLRGSFKERIYPASGYNEVVLAYLMEISYGRMSKAQVSARFLCVVDPFRAPNLEALDIPVMILEASNDPLVPDILRTALRKTYPEANFILMGDVGHFPYLNQPAKYTGWLQEFLSETAFVP